MNLPSKSSFFIFCLLVALSLAQYSQIIPADESERDTSFLEFKKWFLQTLKSRDSIALYSILQENVAVGFDMDGRGIVEFKKRWLPHDTSSNFWRIAYRIVSLGCISDKGEGVELFVCPYSFQYFPDSLDAISHIVVTEKEVCIYDEPSKNAKKILQVDYAVLKISYGAPEGWVKVKRLPNNQTGYIQSEFVYYPAKERMIFIKVNKNWKIQSFLCGD